MLMKSKCQLGLDRDIGWTYGRMCFQEEASLGNCRSLAADAFVNMSDPAFQNSLAIEKRRPCIDSIYTYID